MSNPDFDKKVWEFIENFYKESCGKLEDDRKENQLEDKRKKNQLEAYWCRPAGENQALFTDPKQRMFARFLRSYLNTTWHKIGKGNGSIIDWFDSPEIIKEAESKYSLLENEQLKNFCEDTLNFMKYLSLKSYEFEEEQIENFKIFSDDVKEKFNKQRDQQKDLSKSQKVSVSVGEIFNELQKTQKVLSKSQKVSVYEEIIYENICEPYRTIMKMQKLFPGFGIALSCDFLKESHLCNIAKPDIHLCHVFSLIDGIPYSMDLALVKRVAEFAANVCPADKNNFCGSGAYNVDKIIWQICSDYDVDNDKTKKLFKKEFLDKIAENNIIKTERMIDL